MSIDWKKSADDLKSRLAANEKALRASVGMTNSSPTYNPWNDKPSNTPAQPAYSSPAPSYASSAPNYSMPASSYSGPASVIGNVSGSQDIGKSYQDIFNSTRNESNMYKQLNTWGDNKGNVYDTTQMTPQQIYALSLSKNNNPNASAVLQGMGLDMNGNPTSPITYTPNSASAPSTPYTKNPTVDAMPIDQQLAYYAKNPQEAQQEIARAQGVGGTAAMNWASQLQGVIPQSQGSSQPTGGASIGQGSPMGQPMGGQAGGQMVGQTRDNSWISKSVMDELARQKQAIDQQLAQLQQSSQLNVNQNNQFLADQTKKLQEQKAVTDQQIQNFQNRRGGFYSGGVDYQMGNNTRSTNEAVGSVTKDVQARNNDIWGRNSLLAQQAAEKISLLTQQAPDKIRELMQQQMEKDRAQANIDRTFNYNAEQDRINQTGYYDPYADVRKEMSSNSAAYASASPEEQKRLHDRNVQLAASIGASDQTGSGDYNLPGPQRTIAGQTFDMQKTRELATLTGYLPDGQPTNAKQQQDLQNMWTVAEQTGVIPNQLADFYGLPHGTQTQAAKTSAIQLAISQQSANTSSASVANSNQNAKDRLAFDKEQAANKPKTTDYKTDPNFASDVAYLKSKPDAAAQLDANAQAFINEYGYDGYLALRKAAGLD